LDFLFLGGYRGAVGVCLRRIREGKQTKIFTPNAEMLAAADRDLSLMRLLKSADLAFPDGIGVYIGARLRGIAPKERTNGIDLGERILKLAVQRNMPVFLLGAIDGVAESAGENLCTRIDGLVIAGTHHGYFSKFGKENDAVIDKIDRSGAQILFVCFGFPEQERWICENLPRLKNVKLAAGLGGSLDVWSGRTTRAPKIVRRAGLEWLWRAILSPRRIARLPRIFSFAVTCLKKSH
jgi:N-acetylglucosaminyldiphosphoundecaprenol N-acetyl-beta-D-mannosaminyltransferase